MAKEILPAAAALALAGCGDTPCYEVLDLGVVLDETAQEVVATGVIDSDPPEAVVASLSLEDPSGSGKFSIVDRRSVAQDGSFELRGAIQAMVEEAVRAGVAFRYDSAETYTTVHGPVASHRSSRVTCGGEQHFSTEAEPGSPRHIPRSSGRR